LDGQRYDDEWIRRFFLVLFFMVILRGDLTGRHRSRTPGDSCAPTDRARAIGENTDGDVGVDA